MKLPPIRPTVAFLAATSIIVILVGAAGVAALSPNQVIITATCIAPDGEILAGDSSPAALPAPFAANLLRITAYATRTADNTLKIEYVGTGLDVVGSVTQNSDNTVHVDGTGTCSRLEKIEAVADPRGDYQRPLVAGFTGSPIAADLVMGRAEINHDGWTIVLAAAPASDAYARTGLPAQLPKRPIDPN
jgi:hypothetical protein